MQKEKLGTCNRYRGYKLIMLCFEYLKRFTVLSNCLKNCLPVVVLQIHVKLWGGGGGVIRIFGTGLKPWSFVNDFHLVLMIFPA